MLMHACICMYLCMNVYFNHVCVSLVINKWVLINGYVCMDMMYIDVNYKCVCELV